MKRITTRLAAIWLLMALAPSAFAVVDRTGTALDEKALLGEGKHVIYVFWQSWCGACRKEAPGLVRSSRALADRAQFIGVVSGPDDVIDERRVDRFIQDTGLTFPQVRDRDLSLTRRFNVKGTPTIIVLNPAGKIVYRGHHAPERWLDIPDS